MSFTKCKAEELPDNVLVLEPRTTYDRAVLGYTDTPKDHWPRKGGVTTAVYSRKKCIEALVAVEGMEYEDAVEWYDFNTSGAWVGEGTPMFRA